MAPRKDEPPVRVAAIVEEPNPSKDARWAAALEILLEAGAEPEEAGKAGTEGPEEL